MKNLMSIGYMDTETYQFNPHQHDIWEISYYFSGVGITTIGESEIPFQPGTIICQPPGIPHAERAEKGYRNIYFSIGSLDAPKDKALVFMDNETRIVHTLLMQLHAEFHLRRKNWMNICEALLQGAYAYMQSFTQEKRWNPYVEQLKNLLISNLSNRNASISGIMRHIPLSKDHIRRCFLEETGKTPIDYLTEHRLMHARRLLGMRRSEAGKTDPRILIKEIAGMCGYGDPYYFSKVFHKATGKSPSEWSP